MLTDSLTIVAVKCWSCWTSCGDTGHQWRANPISMSINLHLLMQQHKVMDKTCPTVGYLNETYRQMMETERGGWCLQCYFQGLVVISLTWRWDLDGEEKWIWPQGRVELWHWLRRRRGRRRRWLEGLGGQNRGKGQGVSGTWESNCCLKSLKTH